MRRAGALVAGIALLLTFVAPIQPASAAPKRTYTYEVRGRGSSASLQQFATLAAQSLQDPRGWSLGANVRFLQVSSGGNFTLWLAGASSVPSFGSPCDRFYSCRVGRNVVVNQDRWLHATPPWNRAGGSLRDYRHMVVNHEVGHWLGFGHASCTGRGNPAPVMQQQSISLQGCRFNPWPTAGERTTLSRRTGVAINHSPFGWVAAPKRTKAGIFVGGWTIDPDSTRRVTVRFYVDGKFAGAAQAKQVHAPVGQLYPPWKSDHAFRVTLPAGKRGTHQVCVVALNLSGTPGGQASLGCGSYRVT